MFEIYTAVFVQIAFFWILIPYSVHIYACDYGGGYGLMTTYTYHSELQVINSSINNLHTLTYHHGTPLAFLQPAVFIGRSLATALKVEILQASRCQVLIFTASLPDLNTHLITDCRPNCLQGNTSTRNTKKTQPLSCWEDVFTVTRFLLAYSLPREYVYRTVA
jgi:hypothetical protein